MGSQGGTEGMVLGAIYNQESATRARIAQDVGLSLRAVSTTLHSLIDRKLVLKGGSYSSGSGHPSTLYTLTGLAGLTVGISFDLESFGWVAIDATNSILARNSSRDTSCGENRPDAGKLLHIIGDLCEEAIGALGGRSVDAIGLALPGLVDSETGTWVSGLRIQGVDRLCVRDRLEERFALPVVVDDIARTIAFHARTLGAGKGISDLAVLHLGMGVGSGVIINGKLYGGRHGAAGEIGHLIADPHGYRCICGNTGCFETVLSVPGIVRSVNERRQEVGLPIFGDATGDTGCAEVIPKILDSARSGDRLTRTVLFETGAFLGDAVAKLISLYDPESLVITGAGALFREFFEDSMRQTLIQRSITAIHPNLNVIFDDYEPHHEAAGAALLAMEHRLRRRA